MEMQSKDTTMILFFIFFKKIYLFIVHTVSWHACQKRVWDLIIDGFEPLYGCWELDSGPLEELVF